VVVITAGFKETGPEGAALERKLVEIAQKYNIRMIGPNCFGVLNTHEDVTMNASFSRTKPLPGRIGFMSQSGALGEAILSHARRLGIGFSMFASVGNKADISGNALINYWKDDPDTEIILLYLESFGNPEQFTHTARAITRTKPIIAVKSGKTTAGARATISHTGALAGHDIGADALFDQCGVLRVNSMDELFGLAKALDRQPLPEGNRVAILTNAGGPGILATDAAAGLGLEITTLDPKTVATLKANLPAAAATGNPVDMIASASPENYDMALRALLADPQVDAIICIFVPPIMIDEIAVADAIIAATRGAQKPVLSCFMGAGEGTTGPEKLKSAGIPVYTFPEEIANVLRMMHKYYKWKSRPLRTASVAPDPVIQARRSLKEMVKSGRTQLLGGEALTLLADCGIPTAPMTRASDRDDAGRLAERIGYPVVLKLEAEGLAHKTEVGGVITDVRNREELEKYYDTLLRRATRHNLPDPGVLVQSMIKGGLEMAIGMVRDPQFGPLVMCGFGGVFIEVVNDVAFKLPPLHADDAREMLLSLKGSKLLSGYRGAPPVDIDVLVETLVTVSHLVADFPELHELDINPFIASQEGKPGGAIDARMILGSQAVTAATASALAADSALSV
jgi:acetyltransferase